MCFNPPKQKKLADPIPQPEKVAEPSEIGDARKAEDETLFGGVPDLRVDRSVTSGGTTADGTGLKLT